MALFRKMTLSEIQNYVTPAAQYLLVVFLHFSLNLLLLSPFFNASLSPPFFPSTPSSSPFPVSLPLLPPSACLILGQRCPHASRSGRDYIKKNIFERKQNRNWYSGCRDDMYSLAKPDCTSFIHNSLILSCDLHLMR